MENENDQLIEETDDAEQNAVAEEEEVNWETRAKELEVKAIKQREKTKELKAELEKYKLKVEKITDKKANDLDYGKITFLEHRGIKNPDDQKMVQAEADRLKMPLNQIVEMEYMQERLRTSQDQREAMAGMPHGRGSASGMTKADVDYWLAKGETPDDQELAEKVIEARIKKHAQSNKFSDDLYT